MKILLAVVLALGMAHASASDSDAIEAAKQKAVREFKELQVPQFRKLQIIRAHDGKPFCVCGEVAAKNHPEFTKFYVFLDGPPGTYKRGADSKAMDELVDTVCATGT